MEHLALYRKYRPKTFEEVIGQDHITKTLANQILAGKISHAYLFTGTRGTGKTSIAKIFAKAVNCENTQTGSPCGECEVCKRLAQDNDINIVHMLSDSAFNALLKTLEEPPKYVIFILATTEVHKLPATILSRCVRFDFRLVSVADLSKLLARIFDKEGIKYDAEALKLIASAGEGSVRDTLSIADCVNAYSNGNVTKENTLKVLGTTDYDLLVEFFDKIIQKDIGGMLSLINEMDSKGKNLSVFAKDVSKHARDLLAIKTCKNPNEILNLPNDVFAKFEEQANTTNEKNLIRYMQLFSAAESELRYSLSTRLLLETTSLSAIMEEEVKKN